MTEYALILVAVAIVAFVTYEIMGQDMVMPAVLLELGSGNIVS